MTLAMIFLRSSVDMVKVRSEDLDCAEIGAIGWTLSMLATVAAEIETADLLKSQLWQKVNGQSQPQVKVNAGQRSGQR